jgi:hypothetical protein
MGACSSGTLFSVEERPPSSSMAPFCRMIVTSFPSARKHHPNTHITRTMETKYRTLLQLVALVALFAAVWHIQ